MTDFNVSLGPLDLSSPLIAASGTVGSVYDFADVDALGGYGAAVAKSVSHEPWPGRAAPRMAHTGKGMLNGIGIQNPGIDAWRSSMPDPGTLPVPVWGSAVGRDAAEFALVAEGLAAAGVAAIDVPHVQTAEQAAVAAELVGPSAWPAHPDASHVSIFIR